MGTLRKDEVLERVFDLVDELKDLTDRLREHTEAREETTLSSLTELENHDT